MTSTSPLETPVVPSAAITVPDTVTGMRGRTRSTVLVSPATANVVVCSAKVVESLGAVALTITPAAPVLTLRVE
jgi:hypothetical protein